MTQQFPADRLRYYPGKIMFDEELYQNGFRLKGWDINKTGLIYECGREVVIAEFLEDRDVVRLREYFCKAQDWRNNGLEH